MRRRDFLKGVAITPAAMAASQWSAVAGSLGAKPSRVTAVVYDERYGDCRLFAETLARQGASLFPTGGDAARVWYGALRAHLEKYDGCVAGMTTDSDRVISDACGKELNLRLVYEGSHDGRAAGRLKHRLRGSGGEKEVYAALLRADAPWAESIATALCRPTLAERIVSALAKTPAVTTPQSAACPGYLASWLLVPLRREKQSEPS